MALHTGGEQPLPKLDVLLLCPGINGCFRHNKLRAACCGDVFGQGDAEPRVPKLVYGLVNFGLRAIREQLVGFVNVGVFRALLISKVYMLITAIVHHFAVEILVAARADSGEVKVVDLGGRVESLMPSSIVPVAECDDVGKRVVVVYYEGEVAHRFIAVICRYGKGAIGVGVFGDDVWVLYPVWLEVLHPLNDFT